MLLVWHDNQNESLEPQFNALPQRLYLEKITEDALIIFAPF